MPLSYAFKRVLRSWQIFVALLLGIILASTFFAGINIKADVTAKQALDQSLSNIHVDILVQGGDLRPTTTLSVINKILSVEGVKDAEPITSCWTHREEKEDKEDSVLYENVRLVGFRNNSRIYEGWLNRPSHIGENETYIVKGSPIAKEFKTNDIIQINLSYSLWGETVSFKLNLEVKGIAELDEKAYAIASGNYRQFNIFTQTQTTHVRNINILLVDWDKTLRPIMELFHFDSYTAPSTDILVYIDREALIDPWDVDGSIQRIEELTTQINNEIASSEAYASNNLRWALELHRFVSMFLRFALIMVSLPIFFMAWYMGTTVSDVSFNLRRREIGLLLTKGFSRRQLQSIFLTETLLIGLLGGVLGALLGFLLNPLFTMENQFVVSPITLNPYTMLATVIFGAIIAFLSAFNSARKASKMQTVDALREYLYIEETKPYKKKWPVLALILGTYKIIIFLLGINVASLLINLRPNSFIIMLLFAVWIGIDFVLTYIGPLLFFWGFTKIFIQGSLKFQEFTARVARAFSELGALATKNIRRNPARTTAIAFLLALIVGYSVQVIGQLASEEDYVIRQIYADVGADISVHVSMATNVSSVMENIVANVSESILNSTVEHSFSLNSAAGALNLRAVEPYPWLKTAYYENEWFSGNDVSEAFKALAEENETIILERTIAEKLDLDIGDYISFYGTGSTFKLKVVGFFGPDLSSQTSFYGVSRFWSFVSEEVYRRYRPAFDVSSRLLLKLREDVNGTAVAEQIRQLDGVTAVNCVEENLSEARSNIVLTGIWDVQRLGIVFAVLAASVGTGLISAVSMKERGREAAIMSVRGLSYKQMLIVFLTENLATVIFSVVLGLVVGLIIVHGNISAANSQSFGLVMRRIIFPPPSAFMLLICVTLIFASTILPIILLCRRYLTKLERMVRIR